MKKSGLSGFTGIFLSMVMVLALAGTCLAAPKMIGIAGGPNGGAYFPLSIGVSQVIQKVIPGIKVDVAVTAGAVENCTLVGTGEMDMAFTNGDAAHEAFNGTGRYKGKQLGDMRLMFGGVPGGVFHVVVAKDGGIKSFDQLKGKRVAFGPQGGATEFLAPLVLKYYGVTPADMKLTYLSFADGVQALTDGQVDAAMITSPMPAAAVKELQAVGKLKFDILTVDPDKQDQFLKDNPFYAPYEISPAMYGLERAINTVATTNVMVINAKIDEEAVYQITKGIFENPEIMTKAHPSAAQIKVQNAAVTYIPLHPGAAKYYKEKGLLK